MIGVSVEVASLSERFNNGTGPLLWDDVVLVGDTVTVKQSTQTAVEPLFGLVTRTSPSRFFGGPFVPTVTLAVIVLESTTTTLEAVGVAPGKLSNVTLAPASKPLPVI